MTDLSGRIALVTGASRGIGREIAIELARAGVDVAVNFLSHEEGARETQGLIAAMGRRCGIFQADVSIASEVARLAAAVEKELGPVDILVSNAGMIRPEPIETITEQSWDEVVDRNLKSSFLAAQAVLPGMRARKWGRLIFLSSVAAQLGGLVGPHYAAAKAGAIGLAHSYANILAKEGITSNAIAPALIETDMVRNNPRARPDIIPIGRFGTVEETAAVAVMLAGNGYITGQTINVNGGWYMS